jgi:hypothetical protein
MKRLLTLMLICWSGEFTDNVWAQTPPAPQTAPSPEVRVRSKSMI